MKQNRLLQAACERQKTANANLSAFFATNKIADLKKQKNDQKYDLKSVGIKEGHSRQEFTSPLVSASMVKSPGNTDPANSEKNYIREEFNFASD